MAIILNGSSQQLRSVDFGTSRPAAYSIAGWFKAFVDVTTAGTDFLATIAAPSARGDLSLSWRHATATFRNRAILHITGGTFALSGTPGSTALNVWMHRAAVYTGTQLLFYENGALVGTAVSAIVTGAAPSNWFHTIGTSVTLANRFNGKAAMQAYYDIGLTAADVKALSKYSPEMVRPQNLRSFYPGLRDAKNLIVPGGTAANLTFDNDNPPIIF
jgi:hypothetical protein